MIGANFGAMNGSVVRVIDGTFGPYFHADAGSRVAVSNGSFGRLFSALAGSAVSIRGGEFGERFYAFAGCDVTIAGGKFGDNFRAYDGSHINFRGTEFYLNGEPILGLISGRPTLIADRDVMLSGVLADGSPFSFELGGTDWEQKWSTSIPYDFFAAGSTLTITLVPEPSDLITAVLCLSLYALDIRRRSVHKSRFLA
jgi:hypothetical protein